MDGAAHEREVQRLTCQYMSDELGLETALWSGAAVQALILRQYWIRLAVRTTGTYLARYGFTARKSLRRPYEQQPAAVRHWLRHESRFRVHSRSLL
jgi:transposase